MECKNRRTGEGVARDAASSAAKVLYTLESEKKCNLPFWLFSVQQLCAAVVASLLLMLDMFSAGLLLLPGANQQLLGVSIVILATATGQLVFAVTSDLPVGLGKFIVENIPMLHSMALVATRTLSDQPERIEPTILASYAIASVLTSLAFFLLGYFQMEEVFKILPKPVLMGCLAGMGIYIFFAGLGTCTGETWAWTAGSLGQQLKHWRKLALYLCLESLLLTGLKLTKGRAVLDAFVLPFFFLTLIICSWICLGLSGMSLRSAQQKGWFFETLETPKESAFTWRALSLISWDVILGQLPVILGVVLFSCLHVPINIPALSAYVGSKAQINTGLLAHGWANLSSSVFGFLQVYQTFSTSILYHKCGGGARVTGIFIALMLFACIPYISVIVPCLPRLLAGLFLCHIGVELMVETLLDTWSSLDFSEYLILCIIAVLCNVSFVSGLLLGLLCACVAFVAQCSRSDPVRFTFYPGRRQRSRRLRSTKEMEILEEYDQSSGFLILRLHGNLFFGNTHSLPQRVQNVDCQVILIDFAHVTSLDSSAFSELNALAETLARRHMPLICSSLRDTAKLHRYPCLAAAVFVKNMEEGIAEVEQMALTQPPRPPSPASPRPSRHHLMETTMASPRDESFFLNAVNEILTPMGFSLETCHGLLPFFVFQRAPMGTILWKAGDDSDFAFLLASGRIGVCDEFCDQWRNGDERSNFVEICGPDHFCGELSLFMGESRKNKLVAVEDLSLWTITRRSLLSMQEQQLPLAFAFQSIALRYAAHRMNLSMLDGNLHSI